MTRTTHQSDDFGSYWPTGLLLLAISLILIGLVMVASTTVKLDDSVLGAMRWDRPFGRQLIFAGVGVIMMLLAVGAARRLLDAPGWIRFLVLAGALVTAVGLVAALLPGIADPHRGSSRWLRLGGGGFSFGAQPSEPAKVVLVGLVAWLLTRPGVDPRSFTKSFLPAALSVILFAGLVAKEDFGTAALIGALGGSMMFVAGCRWRDLGGLAALGLIGTTVLVRFTPYRWKRVTAFTNIWADPQGNGYQPIQSLTAIASGGWLGSGLGSGIHKYGYLPESHTDFIFSAICEEMGVLGGLLVIALYATLVWIGARAALSARTRFERLLACGLTLLIALQAAMNIAVVTVLTPTTGIPLPFVSAGGSGMITFCLATGVLGAIVMRTPASASDRLPADADLASGVPAW